MNIPPFEFPHLQRLEFALKTTIGALNIVYNYHLYILFHPRKYKTCSPLSLQDIK
jgi:hypothetical protein